MPDVEIAPDKLIEYLASGMKHDGIRCELEAGTDPAYRSRLPEMVLSLYADDPQLAERVLPNFMMGRRMIVSFESASDAMLAKLRFG